VTVTGDRIITSRQLSKCPIPEKDGRNDGREMEAEAGRIAPLLMDLIHDQATDR